MLDLLLPSPAALSEHTLAPLLLAMSKAEKEEEEKEQVEENKEEGETIMQTIEKVSNVFPRIYKSRLQIDAGLV